MVASESPDVCFVVPLHLNPAVRRVVIPILQPHPNISIHDPIDYLEFVGELARCGIVVTDSGGLQEGPGLGKPVLVARNTTERPEAIDAGTARLVGTAEEDVYRELRRLLDDEAAYDAMATAVNPYGDGHAVPRPFRSWFGRDARDVSVTQSMSGNVQDGGTRHGLRRRCCGLRSGGAG